MKQFILFVIQLKKNKFKINHTSVVRVSDEYQ